MAQIPQIDYATPPPSASNQLALTSMVLGIVSLPMLCIVSFLSVPVALTGLILGIIAIRKIRKGTQGGKGMAITGIACSGTTLLIVVALVGVYLFYFRTLVKRSSIAGSSSTTYSTITLTTIGPTTAIAPLSPSPPAPAYHGK